MIPMQPPAVRHFALLTFHLVAWLVVGVARSQCPTQWRPESNLAGTDRSVKCMREWDPDGPGGQPALLVVGGAFTVAGSVVADQVAAWDGVASEWRAIGTSPFGAGSSVNCMAALANGDLVVGGETNLGQGRVAQWNGTSWVPIGSFNQRVSSIAVAANGDLVVGGDFTMAGTVAVSHVARWNGTIWTGLGAGCDGTVFVIVTAPNGDLVCGGGFDSAGGLPASRVARWNGSSWSAVGGNLFGFVADLDFLSNGDLVAAGSFFSSNVFRLSGSNWIAMGAGIPSGAFALSATSTGRLFGAGTAGTMFEWTGVTWVPVVGSPNGIVRALLPLANGSIAVGGDFVQVGSMPAFRVARWNNNAWSAFGSSAPLMMSPVLALGAQGELYAAFGNTTNSSRVMVKNAGAWTQIGATSGQIGTAASPGLVQDLLVLPDGRLVALGNFSNVNGVGASRCARWNAGAWQPLGSPANLSFYQALLLDGDLVVIGHNGAWRWSDSSLAWTLLAPDLLLGAVASPRGELIATRYSAQSQYALSLWRGSAWTDLGVFDSSAAAVTQTANGDIYVGGWFTSVNGVAAARIARFDGVNWSALGSGLGPSNNSIPQAIVPLPDGGIAAGGYFTTAGGLPAAQIARWNGTAWSAFGSGTNNAVSRLLFSPDGSLMVSGSFTIAGGNVSPGWATIRPSCPASLANAGAGCAGAGGGNVLTVEQRAWLGASFRSQGSQLPPLAAAIAVIGFAPTAVPLASILPQGTAGCDLLVAPALTELLLTATGSVDFSVPIPNVTALIAQSFRHQLVLLELDPQLDIVSLTSTNAWSATVGVF